MMHFALTGKRSMLSLERASMALRQRAYFLSVKLAFCLENSAIGQCLTVAPYGEASLQPFRGGNGDDSRGYVFHPGRSQRPSPVCAVRGKIGAARGWGRGLSSVPAGMKLGSGWMIAAMLRRRPVVTGVTAPILSGAARPNSRLPKTLTAGTADPDTSPAGSVTISGMVAASAPDRPRMVAAARIGNVFLMYHVGERHGRARSGEECLTGTKRWYQQIVLA